MLEGLSVVVVEDMMELLFCCAVLVGYVIQCVFNVVLYV